MGGTGPDHLCQRQRQHGQIDTAAAHHQGPKHQCHSQRQRHAGQQGPAQTGAPVQVGQRRAIGPQCKKSRMAKTDQTAQSHHPLQTETKQHHDHHVFGQAAAIVALPPSQQRQAHKQSHESCAAPEAHRPERKNRHAFALLSVRGRPRQALRTPHQHHRHGQKHQHQGRLREKIQPQGMDHADQQGRCKSTTNAAQPAGDHHHKGLNHHIHIHLQMGRFTWQLQSPRQARQAAAQHDHAQHDGCGVHAQGVEHVAVLRGRFHALSPACSGEQQMQTQPHQRPQQQGHNLPSRKERLTQLDRPFETGKARGKNLFRPKKPAHRIVQRQRQAKGGDQLVQLWRMAHAL